MGRVRRRGGRLSTRLDQVVLQQALQHEAVSRLARRLAARVPVEAVAAPGTRLAAVAAVLRLYNDEPELLFIKRAEVERDPWSGHMAFPGGRLEAGDVSLEVTAVRETQEELSLDLTRGHMLGRLDDLAPRNASLPAILIRPFVAVVTPDVQFVPNREVASTFWVPLSRLRHPDAQTEHVMPVEHGIARFPAFRVEQHVVWGLTERIVRQLLALCDLDATP